MSSFDLTRPVVRELRAARPRAPQGLREQVLASARQAREPRLSLSPPSWRRVRRVALVAVPAVVVVGVGAALIHGIANSGPSRVESLSRSQPASFSRSQPAGAKAAGTTRVWAGKATTTHTFSQIGAPTPLSLSDRGKAAGGGLAPSKGRLQDYRASLTVRVDGLDGLSPSTQKAMRTARVLGGYVVSAQFNAAKQGYSELVFRIPVTRVQQAIARFSELGTIAAQDIQITDLQTQYNRLVKEIGALRIEIAKVDDKLADPALSNADRVRLQQRRARLVATVEALTTTKGQTVKRARLATVSLRLTTEQAVVPHKPHRRGPLGGALDDAGTILARELSWALYAVVVLGPLAAIGLVAFLLVRVARRYSDRRLLESS